MTATADAFLRINPRLGEAHLAELVARLDERIERQTANLRAEGADEAVIEEVREFHLAWPFEAQRPQAQHLKYLDAYDRLVERIGTPKMRAALDNRRQNEAAGEAMFRAITAQAQGAGLRGATDGQGLLPENQWIYDAELAEPFSVYKRKPAAPPAPARPPVTAQRAQRILRDVARARHILQRDGGSADEIAAFTDQRLGDAGATAARASAEAERAARRLEREARQADERGAARRWTPPLDDDGLADDERILAEIQRKWTPTRVLNNIMRPATRAVSRVRRAERAIHEANGRHAIQRAAEELARVRAEWDVAPVLGADLAAERELLRPIVEAAVAGTSDRWRHRMGRVFDENGRDLMPPCLRQWQVL